MASTLSTHRQDRTLVLTISDPATRNTLSPQVYAAALEALESAESDPELRCVVLCGDGAHFCAGGDLNRLAHTRTQGAALAAENVERFHTLVEAIRSHPKPVIAAVEGFAAGGGCSLALACDLIVASESARFVMSYGRAGLSSDGGGLWQLMHSLPRAQVLKFLWLPEPQTARDWLDSGLVTQVVDTGHALPEALRLAARLAAMAPNALASVKELANDAPGRTLRQHLDGEREHFVRNLLHPNAGEGVKAFFDKRAPDFGDA